MGRIIKTGMQSVFHFAHKGGTDFIDPSANLDHIIPFFAKVHVDGIGCMMT